MPDQEKIVKIRKQIDKIDTQIIELLSERLQLTGEIGVLKGKINKPVIDKEREADLNLRLEKMCLEKGIDPSFIFRLWQLILEESYQVQNGKK